MPNHYGTKKKIPSKNKRGSVPPDYDVILPGMGYTKPTAKKQPKKKKRKPRPVPLPIKPKSSPSPMPKKPTSPIKRPSVRPKPKKKK